MRNLNIDGLIDKTCEVKMNGEWVPWFYIVGAVEDGMILYILVCDADEDRPTYGHVASVAFDKFRLRTAEQMRESDPTPRCSGQWPMGVEDMPRE